MAKFYGKIGYVIDTEIRPGYWDSVVTERYYSGDVIKNTGRWVASTDSTNDDITINNQISIIADPFANENSYAMRYVEFMDTVWKITGVEVLYPKLILTIGGVYNGQQATTASDA